MVLEVDVEAFIQNLRATKPPYKCPYGNCEKVYKSYSGIQHHLYHFDHDNPEPAGQTPKSGSKPHKKKGGHNKHHHRSIQRSPSPQERIPTQPHTRETLSYKESQRMVEISLGGQTFCVDIYQPLDVISQDEIDNQNNTEKEEKEERSMQKPAKGNENGKSRKENATAAVPSQPAKLPEVQVKVLEDYIRPKMPPTPSSSYYRHIEKTAEELDEEVEYDMDEEDHVWLDMMNETRTNNSTAAVSQEAFETLMDRFEKEAFFQSQSAGKDQGPSIDEDAVCSICMDGECQNTNVILFCDMCNLAVHQECYGVPYIPEGQWLCRRCLQSPSRAVDCVLCPNKGGAFKQTDDGRWAHVVCALWVPEVGFANTVFLEPIDCLERIPPARKKLTCYVCKQRGSGACIQCHRPNCYTAFHVTCAQQAGLYMKIEPDSMPAGVKKTALCDVHMSPDSEWTPMMVNSDSPDQKTSLSPEDAKAQRRKKMRRARKILESRRKAIPVISIPTIPENRLSEIASLVDIPKKDQFLKCLQSYWTLKRQSRFGVPLLKRLQSNHMNRNKENKNDKQSSERQEQLQYWQHIRQNLEKARLLTELVRKREKVKREWVNVRMLCFEYELQPFVVFLRSILQQLQEFDTDDIFAQPVSLEEVPDYREVVQHPMDFSTMKSKVENHSYRSFDQFTKDFDLMVRNCMDYNEDDTVYYEAAVQLKKEGGVIIEAARKQVEQVGYDMDTGLHLPLTSNSQSPEGMEEGSSVGQEISKDLPLEEQLTALQDRLTQINNHMTGGRRAKLAKTVRKQLMTVRRKLSMLKRRSEPADAKAEDSASSGSDVEAQADAPSTTAPRTPSPPPAASPPSSPRTTPPHSKTPSRGGGRGRGRGRGRVRGGHNRSRQDMDEPPKLQPNDKAGPVNKQRLSTDQPPELKAAHTPSPAGVNRRNAVLFSKKKKPPRNPPPPTPSKSPPPSSSDHTPSSPPPVRKPGRPPKNKIQQQVQEPIHVDTSEPKSPESSHSRGPTSPLGPFSAGRKRSGSMGQTSDSEMKSPTPKRATLSSETNLDSIGDGPEGPDLAQRDSFKTYRSRNIRSSSESDTTSELSSGDESDTSTCSSSNQSPSDACSEPETMWLFGPKEMNQEMLELPPSSSPGVSSPASASTLSPNKSPGRTRRSPSVDYEDLISLEPLDLVWAKCRGYPWYPALIINPKMPKTGYFHNGVPIPVPPDDVLELPRRQDETYLVLFFDTKRTWQWLPRHKLEPLGVKSDLDKAKLMENKKPNVRKAVQKAYEKAIIHRCKVNGDPNPLSGDSSSED